MKKHNVLKNLSDRIFDPKKCFIIATILIALYVVILSIICSKRYFCFQYNDWDFAIYTNAMWNLIHGQASMNLLNETLLHDHASFIAYVIAIPYFIFRHPVTLLVLQSLALGISAFPVYLVAKDKLGHIAGLIITLIYLNYPAIYYANLYEFYFEAFALPFLGFAFYFLLENKKILFILMLVGACSCKENIPLTVAAMGVFGLTRPHRRLLGLAAIILGIFWFYFDIKVLAGPAVQNAKAFGENLRYIGAFAQYGSNLQEVIGYLLLHPFEIFKTIFFDPARVKLIYDTVGILLFIPIIRLDILMINAPHVMARLLALNPNEYTVYYHSAAPLAPIVFFSFIFSIRSIIKIIPKAADYKYYILAGVLVFESICGISLWKERPGIVRFNLDRDPIGEEFIKQIPSQAFVASSLKFLPHLANRTNVRSIHTLFGNRPWWKGDDRPLDLEYILIDTQDGVMRAMFFQGEELFDIELLPYLEKNNFGLVKALGDTVLFRRYYPGDVKLLDVSKGPAVSPDKYKLKVGDDIKLLKYDYKMAPEYVGVQRFTFYWYKENDSANDYLVRFFITEGGYERVFAAHSLGYTMLPPSLWRQGDIIEENYWLVLPPLSSGNHRLSVDFIDLKNKKKAEISSPNTKRIDTYGKYELVTLSQQ